MAVQQILMLAAALFVVYANLATVLRSPTIEQSGFRLPLPQPVYRALVLHGVFSTFSTNNTEVSVWGLAQGIGTNSPYWKELPTEDYFPFKRPEQRKRLWTSRQRREMSPDTHHDVWEALGTKILTRYNDEHPGTPISAVALQAVSWPGSPQGFYANQAEAIGKRRFWIIKDLSAEPINKTR